MRDIMPRVRYYSYIEITTRAHQTLWHEYEAVAEQYAPLRHGAHSARSRTFIRCSGNCSKASGLRITYGRNRRKDSAAGRWS